MTVDQDSRTAHEDVLLAEIARLRAELAMARRSTRRHCWDATDARHAGAGARTESRQETAQTPDDAPQSRSAAAQADVGHDRALAIAKGKLDNSEILNAALRASEGRLRLILESATDYAIIAIDRRRRVISWNAGAQNTLGWDEAEMLGRDAAQIWTPEDRAAGVPQAEMRIAEQEGRATDERWHMKRDGSRFWGNGEMMPMRDDGDVVVGFLKILRDRTEQRAVQSALRASEERYRKLFNAIDQGFCLIEIIFDGPQPVDFRYIEVNAAFERHSGLKDVVGRTIRDLSPNHEQYWLATYARVALTGEPIRFENTAAALGNRWYDVYAFRVEEPEAHRVAVLFNDITEARKTAQELARSHEELEQLVEARTGELAHTVESLRTETAERAQAEAALRQSQKMEAVGQLTGGLAHDFNNLITGISGSLELLKTRVAQGRIGDADRYIATAQGAANRAAALTHRLLAFSRRQTLDPKPIQPKRLIAGMEDLVQRTVGPGITVQATLGDDLWSTLCDPNQLENAVLNLCINARDAMPDGGMLTISTANTRMDERMARERDMAPGPYVSVSITDTGTGMPPQVVVRAFDPFFTTKPIGMGTGLGLSMVYGFAKQSGGQARIHSTEGLGTTVQIHLPCYEGEAEPETTLPDLANAPRARDGETVLVVDDEANVRMLVTEVLEDLGYAVIEAADAASGLKVLSSDIRIDLLVTDVGLPGGMNGRQMTDAARKGRPELKVLFITGYAEAAVARNGQLESGMHVMVKPFAMETLAMKVNAVIWGR